MAKRILTRAPARTLLLVGALTALGAYAADEAKTKLKGVITAVQGDTITVVDQSRTAHTVTVSPETKLKKTKGLTNVIHEKVDSSVLAAGLPVTVEGTGNGSQLAAREISFRSEDLRTTRQIEAGMATTNAEVGAMGKRMDEFGTYEQLDAVDVTFDSGSAKLSAAAKSSLDTFAAKAKQTKNYAVVLQGFTDSTGNAAANQRLSTQRANAVANYLQQNAGLAPGRVRAGDGMGVAPDAGSGSNSSARKVVAKLVVDKGVQAGAKP
ncbi:OmpA family protein [Stenotrophomonas bentonitica]|uniref:OmpA family protein n=1 Tax=Stenotrophomonas bentonitica TaxID=1450134 RepID=UPI00345E3896